MTTCEKLWWLIKEGEEVLRPERRSSGRMMFYKSARVEYHPVGVVGAIVPWNYPVHNVLNPASAALFAGNGIVVKVSEHASWSAHGHMRKLLDAAPSALAAKVNPGDPDHSRAILDDWLRGVLRTLHRGEGSAPGHRL